MEHRDTIPIVFSMDNNYVVPTLITVFSLLENKKKSTCYDLYFLITVNFPEEPRSVFNTLIEKYDNCSCHFIIMKEEWFQDAVVKTEHLSIASYYRLFIGEVIDADRCIYMDSDLVIEEDLTELWSIDIGENYLAGVKNWIFQMNAEHMEMHRMAGGLTSMDHYVNAGVLIMNLKKIRKENMLEKFRMHMSKGYVSEDQDVLNICCYYGIYFLPLKYNVYNRYFEKLDRLTGDIYSRKEIQEAAEKPAIIHFASGISKPWENIRCVKADLWWGYALRFMPKTEYLHLRRQAFQNSCKKDLTSLLENCRRYEGVIIFGYTAYSRKLTDMLLKNGVDNILCFIDNNTEKQNMDYRGIKVRSAGFLNETGKYVLVLNACRNSADEVDTMLRNNLVPETDIIKYNDEDFRKSRGYYASLDKRYFMLELEQIYRKESSGDNFNYEEYRNEMIHNNPDDLIEKYHMEYWLIPSEKMI